MRYLAPLFILFFLLPGLCQTQSTTKGACSPVVSGNNNQFTFYCEGMTPEQGKQLLNILNRIAEDQLDPKAVMKSLDEIKALAARGSTSPEAVAQGIQMYASGQQSPREMAQTTYARLTSFLDSRRRIKETFERLKESQEQARDSQERLRQQPQQMQHTTVANRPDYERGTIDRYHEIGLYRIVSNTLESLRQQNMAVGNLVDMNENLKAIDDIQLLANKLKSFHDSRSQNTYVKLVDFLDSERRLRSRLESKQQSLPQTLPSLPDPPSASIPSTLPADDSDRQTVNSYLASYAPAISSTLEQLKYKKIDVNYLEQISQNINSIADIQKLADGFKKLADALPAQ
jgi:hypothetical protein